MAARRIVAMMRMVKRNGGDVAHGHAHHDALPAYKPPVIPQDIQALREKSRLPWSQLTIDDKTKRE